MNRRQFCAAAALGLARSTFAAPALRTPEKHPALLFQRRVPGDDNPDSELLFEWLLVDPDGSNVRPLFGPDGQTVPLEVPHRPAILLRTNQRTKSVTLLKPDGNLLELSWDGGVLERALRQSWKSSRRTIPARGAHGPASSDAIRPDADLAPRVADAAVPLAVLEPRQRPAHFWGFSPDGRRLAFSTTADSGGAPFVLDLRSEKLVCLWDQIPDLRGDVGFADVTFSPDLGWFAYPVTEGRDAAAGKPGTTVLHLTSLDGRTTRRHPDASWAGNLRTAWVFSDDGHLVVGTDPPRGFDAVTGRPTDRVVLPPDPDRLAREYDASEACPCPWGRYCLLLRDEVRVVRELATKREARLPEKAENGFHWVRAARV